MTGQPVPSNLNSQPDVGSTLTPSNFHSKSKGVFYRNRFNSPPQNFEKLLKVHKFLICPPNFIEKWIPNQIRRSYYTTSSSFLSPSNIPSLLPNGLLRFRFRFPSPSYPHYSTLHSSSRNLLLHSHYLTLDLPTLRKLHASLITSTTGYESFAISSKLISLYAHFNDLSSAASVFQTLSTKPNTVIWNSIIKAYVDSGFGNSACALYKRMREFGVPHDCFTFPILNQMIELLEDSCILWIGEMVHSLAIKMGFESDLYFCNTLIKACVKGGRFCYARQVFDKMVHRDLVSWTSMISGCAVDGDVVGAFMLFGKMRMEMEPNFVTMMVMFQVCSIAEGKQLHGYVIRKGLLSDRSVHNSVLKMYSCEGSVNVVEILFGEVEERDVVSWNIMMSYFCLRGEARVVADYFREMRLEVLPSIETLTILISMFGEGRHCFEGRQTHCLAIKSGLCDNILETSLLDFYAKCGKMDAAIQLFIEIPLTSSIISAMISGFLQNGCINDTIELIKQILAASVKPKVEILRSLVVAYSHMGALKLGKGTHGYFIRNFYNSREDTVPLETSILNMYVRCGSISTASICFDRMHKRDLVAWTSMIEGCGIHGLGHEALALFRSMLDEGIHPNRVTILGLLSACSHCGLLSEGCEVFYSMKLKFGIQPDLNHFTCIVDLLGRCGKLKVALAIILKLVALPDSRIWGALLSSCRVHENQKLGKYAAQRLLELEPDNAGYYTLLSNVQANDERWAEVEELRSSMKDRDLIKQPGWSCIEANRSMHGFVAGDKLDPQVNEIYDTLGCLSKNMQDLGDRTYS